MPLVDLICLANSNKMRGRCIAGLRIDGGGLVRPIASDTDHGQLYLRHFRLDDGTEPKVLDIMGVDLVQAAPEPRQPENWVIGTAPWVLRSRPTTGDFSPQLAAAVASGSILLGSLQASIAATDASAMVSSLALVVPSNSRWYLKHDRYDRPQPRVIFEMDRHRYDLPVTDPLWIPRIVRRLSQADLGTYSQERIGIPQGSRVLLTISFGELFRGYCYKLVAAIIVQPQL